MRSHRTVAAVLIVACLVAAVRFGFRFQLFVDPRPETVSESTEFPGVPTGDDTRISANWRPASLSAAGPVLEDRSRAEATPARAETDPSRSTDDNAARAFETFARWSREATGNTGRAAVAELEAEGIRLARRRHEEMEDLIRSDPERAIASSMSESQRAALPPAVAAWVEERVSGRGDLEVLCALPEPGRESAIRPIQRHALIGGTRYRAHVYGRRLTQPTLRDVSLHGIALGNDLAVAESPVRELDVALAGPMLDARPELVCAEGEDHPASNPLVRVLEAYGIPVLLCCPEHANRFEARLAAAGNGTLSGAGATSALAAAPATEGRKRLLFIRVDFSDLQGESFTTNRASDLTRELDRFYQENSFGRAGFHEIGAGSDVTPVFRMPRTASSYGSNDDAGDLRSDARQAARNAGYVLSNYDYDLTCMRSVPGFGWAGLGFVGAPGAWIRGTSSTGVTAHELGHNMGLNHANFWDTGGTSVTGAGESIEYGDKFDTMGAANAGNNHFNARYKRLLGWLREGEYTVVTTNGLYRVHAHDQTNAVSGGSRGLQIFANARTNYWVEFRRKHTSNRWLQNGIGIRWAGRGNEASVLLDTTPGTLREKDDASVTLGRTFSDYSAGVHVTPVAKGDTPPAWIDVIVQRGVFSQNRPPTLSLSASATTGTTSTPFTFQASARDPDGDPIAFYWDFADESLGENAPIQEHRWSSAGEYVVQCVASDTKGGTARSSVLVRIGTPSTLRISGRVSADGEPVAGVRVAAASAERFTTTDSDGRYMLAGLTPGTYTFSAKLDTATFDPVTFTNPVSLQSSRSDLDFAAVDVADRRPVTLIAAGSAWRYWDKGTAPSAAWTRADFVDSDWNLGPAILGYGGDRETTVIDFGADSSRKYITTWFRRAFVIDDPSRLTNLRLGLLRDDGAAVHLNGRELFRDNLPSGTLTPQTLASSTVGGTAEVTYFERNVDLARLVRGTNQFAVEVHQASASSSDIAFDLRLTADAVEILEPGVRLVRPNPDDTFRTPGRVVVSAAVGELTGHPLHHVDFFAEGRHIGSATNKPFAVTWSNPPAGRFVLHASAVRTDGSTTDSPSVTVGIFDADLTPTLISRGAVWRYLDTGVAPDDSWNGLAFDDANWLSGAGRLGYGEDGEVTVIRFGSNPSLRHVTTWFRHAFDLLDPSTVTNLVCRLARDDGAVVYLNGEELYRSGIRTGAVTPTLLAQSEVRDDAEVVFVERVLPASGLREGKNVLAAEVHQVSRTSTDLGFDFELVARRSAVPEVPRLTLRVQDGQLRIGWPARFAGWHLEATSELGGAAAWEAISGTATVQDSEASLALPLPERQIFYRLVREP